LPPDGCGSKHPHQEDINCWLSLSPALHSADSGRGHRRARRRRRPPQPYPRVVRR
jgi:hypothetical protein